MIPVIPTKIEWLNDDLTRATVTVEADGSHWWRRRYVTADVEYIDKQWDYTCWAFVVGGDRVHKHDEYIAYALHNARNAELDKRREAAERARLKNPWTLVEPLPPARIVKQ